MYYPLHDDLVKLNVNYWGTRSVVGGRQGILLHMIVLIFLHRVRFGDSYGARDNRARMSQENIRVYFRMFIKYAKEVYVGRYLKRWPKKEEL